jgi:hypothetical protein
MKAQSSCEKGCHLGQHHVEADVDECSMTGPYLMGARERAFARSISKPVVVIVNWRLALTLSTARAPITQRADRREIHASINTARVNRVSIKRLMA